MHANYKKDKNGRTRKAIEDKNKLIHVMFGAFEYEGKIYPVKITMWEERPTSGKKSSNPGFEFVEFPSEPVLSEKGQSTLLSGSVENPTGINDAPLTISSDGITTKIPVANLLKDFYLTYEHGKNLLAESRKKANRAFMHCSWQKKAKKTELKKH